MGHVPELIFDLALILGAAAVMTIIFKMLKQPVVLGYIIAGVIVGPYFNFFPTVVESDGIKTWAEIGVIFLLFGLGLEFSFKKLLKVGNVAVITSLMGVGMTFLIGYNVGVIMGWKLMDSLFMGGILSIASTTIIFRAFDELGVKSQKFAGIVLGALIIEDLVAVVLMVILSTVSISRSFEGIEMIYSILKLVFFLVLWFVSGIFFLPTMFKKLKKYLNDETLLVVSLALCFLMVVLSSQAGFSPALGAFIMGSILAETPKVEKIEHLVQSVKDLFGAIFFVSVGMLLDPNMLVEYALPIGISTFVLLMGKPIFATIGALLAGQPIKVAVQTGMSLSQIGEFSFIIATLGVTLNVTSDFLYPVAVAVSVLTTFTTPYMIGFSGKVSDWVTLKTPEKWKNRLYKYSLGTQQVTEASDWKKLIRFYLINTVIFSVVIISIILLANQFLAPLFDASKWKNLFIVSLTLLLIAPFLYALAFRRGPSKTYANIWTKPLYRGPLLALIISRIALAIFFIGFVFATYYSPLAAFIGVVVSTFIFVTQRHRIKQFYGRIESRFLLNLHDRERSQQSAQHVLAPWDSHLTKFTLEARSPIIGLPLSTMKLRETFGVNIVIIQRGDITINIPRQDNVLYPNDVISVIGTDEQLTLFKDYIAVKDVKEESKVDSSQVGLHSFSIPDDSYLVGQTMRHSKMRERCNGIVVGLERNEDRMVNPDPDVVFEVDDVIWIVGSNKRIQVYLKEILNNV
ncbi:cation:proton antiporter [Fluviicola taffensis]|uniref:Transporter, CPA2 family n=1 Tax=Fluviicola taffensis (strain DSM 16823 / NCIMB 13979 / RW262) TaxID=755732 RepID=F2II82_FLUTR|nr:cation:proton antiporter [Fluviicola taffensis]AEA43791.1 transporter, CPA2 family [Fluviicola taffensis DSM 16823]